MGTGSTLRGFWGGIRGVEKSKFQGFATYLLIRVIIRGGIIARARGRGGLNFLFLPPCPSVRYVLVYNPLNNTSAETAALARRKKEGEEGRRGVKIRRTFVKEKEEEEGARGGGGEFRSEEELYSCFTHQCPGFCLFPCDSSGPLSFLSAPSGAPQTRSHPQKHLLLLRLLHWDIPSLLPTVI